MRTGSTTCHRGSPISTSSTPRARLGGGKVFICIAFPTAGASSFPMRSRWTSRTTIHVGISISASCTPLACIRAREIMIDTGAVFSTNFLRVKKIFKFNILVNFHNYDAGYRTCDAFRHTRCSITISRTRCTNKHVCCSISVCTTALAVLH